MRLGKYCLWLVMLCTVSVSAASLPQYQLRSHSLVQEIQQYAFLEQTKIPASLTAKKLQIDNVDHRTWSISNKNRQPSVNTGDNWLAFSLTNTAGKDAMYYLSIRSSIKEAEQKVFIRSNDSLYQRANQTSFKANVYVTELPLLANETIDVLIYVNALGAHQLPIKLLSSDTFVDDITDAQFGYGVAIGGVVALALTLIFLYVANNNKMMLLLAGYFIAKALLLSVLLGLNLHLIYPHYSQIKGLELPVLTAAALFCLLWFTVKLFHLKVQLPQWARVSRAICWALLLYMPISVQLSLITNLVVSMAINILISLFLLVLGVQLWRRAHRLAPLFIGVMALQLFFYFIDLLWGSKSVNIYGDNLTLYSVSFWLNGFFITYLLSREYFFQVKDQQITQAEALANAITSKQAQAELLDLQQNSQELLETKVQERTLELNIVLQELESANKELAEKNTRDELTGLFNRRFYDQKILAEYRRSRRNLTPLSLMVIDIDHFKNVNDTYGHLAGDQCIVAVAEAFKQCLRRSSDMACRYGGEEFCVILPETDTLGAVALAEEIRTYISKSPVKYNEQTIELTVSAGVSTYQQQAEAGTDELFSAADQALYIAKDSGRNQVQQHPINSPISS